MHGTQALGIFGNPAKPGAVTTPSTGFGAMLKRLNFGGFASTIVQPATSISLFGSEENMPKVGREQPPDSKTFKCVGEHSAAVRSGWRQDRLPSGKVGVWTFAKRCQGAKNTSCGQKKLLGPRCQVMCPNLNQWTSRPCKALPTLNNLGPHIRRVHYHVGGCIDILRCPYCDEHVSGESLQNHIQQKHKTKTCSRDCMRDWVAHSPSAYRWKNPKLSLAITKSSTGAASTSSPVQAQSFLSTYSTYLAPKNRSIPENLPEVASVTAQLPVRVTDKKRPSSYTIWVRNDIFRPEVFAHKT